jgi:hypothetical protein
VYPLKLSPRYIILFALILTACAHSQAQPSPKAEIIHSSTPLPAKITLAQITPTIQPVDLNPTGTTTSTALATKTLVPMNSFILTQEPIQPAVPSTSYLDLPPGLYLVYENEKDHQVFIITPNNKFQKLLIDEGKICFNSSDGKQIYICIGDKNYLFNIEKDRLDLIKARGEPSPDGHWVVHNCDGYENWESLAIQQIGQEDEYCLLKPTGKNGLTLDYRGWSPDGKWLAYTKEISKTHMYDQPLPEDGLYLVSTNCLDLPETCAKNTEGPFFVDGMSFKAATPWYSHWSPDGRQLALYTNDDSKLFFFTIESKKFSELVLTGGRGWVDGFAFSPDGNTIAYVRPMYPDNCCSFLEPLSGGASIPFGTSGDHLRPLFWLTIPSFHIDQRLKISHEGSHLYMRDQPSMNGKIITQFSEGDEIKILEGPVGFGTYVWWKVHLEQKNLDGWVVEVKEWFSPLEP